MVNFTLGEEIRKDGIIKMSRAWDKEKEKKGNYVGNLSLLANLRNKDCKTTGLGFLL